MDQLDNKMTIPFTVLIIEILADSGNIDPVVVSSCIFMEDEKSETQVDGIVNEVMTCIVISLHL